MNIMTPEEILFFAKENNTQIKYKLQKYSKETYDFIDSITGFSFPEKMYVYVFGTDKNVCIQCKANKTKFLSFWRGYRQFCSVKCSRNNKIVKEKLKKTNLKKYGYDNPAKSAIIKERIRKKFNEKYNVDNISQLDEIQKKIVHNSLKKYGTHYNNYKEKKQKFQRTIFQDTYNRIINQSRVSGVVPCFSFDEYHGQDKYYKWLCKTCETVFIDTIINGRSPKCKKCFPPNISKGERELCEFLDSLGIFYEMNTKQIISPYELDIWIPSLQVAIEYCGLYWHSDIFKERYYHFNKHQLCKNKNIRLITIFSDEWELYQDICQKKLKLILNIDDPIKSQDISINNVTLSEKKQFLKEYEKQNLNRYNIDYGLFYKSELISIISFDELQFNNYELLYFHSNRNIIAGAERLLKYFIEQHNPDCIITYCDLRWDNEDLYKKLGFIEDQTIDPSYDYINQTHSYRLKDIDEDNLDNINYSKIWDCGKTKFIYYNVC